MKCPRRSCDFRGISLRLSSDFGSDYEILKTVCDYATLTRPGSPHIIPGIPAPALLPIPAQIGVACPRQPPMPPGPMPPRPRHAAQGGTKSRTWCSLPRLGNGLCRAYTALAIAVLYAAYAATALESPRKTIVCPDEKIYLQKINRLERQ